MCVVHLIHNSKSSFCEEEQIGRIERNRNKMPGGRGQAGGGGGRSLQVLCPTVLVWAAESFGSGCHSPEHLDLSSTTQRGEPDMAICSKGLCSGLLPWVVYFDVWGRAGIMRSIAVCGRWLHIFTSVPYMAPDSLFLEIELDLTVLWAFSDHDSYVWARRCCATLCLVRWHPERRSHRP